MNSYQNIEPTMLDLIEECKGIAMMTRDQIFDYISRLVVLSDEINKYLRSLDLEKARLEKEALDQARAEKMNASLAAIAVKTAAVPIEADKKWAERQAKLLNEMRIAALSAQRGAE